jgi:hypothetical protein
MQRGSLPPSLMKPRIAKGYFYLAEVSRAFKWADNQDAG